LKPSKSGIGNIEIGTLKIYPNPFTQRTTVEFLNPEMSEYQLIVRDLSGKVVILDQTSTDRIIIERGDLATGLYSIELAGKKIYRDRFIIK
jgi:hypothetical protein